MGLSDQFQKTLNDLGDYGPYQKRAFFLLALSTIPTGWHAYSQVLLSFEPEFACGTPKPAFDFETSNFSDYKSLVVPDFNRFEDLSTDKAAQCYMYKYYDIGPDGVDSVDRSTAEGIAKNSSEIVKCSKEDWIFDQKDFTRTATTEWGNVCDKKALNTFDTQSFMIGKMVGAFIFGAMSDAIGRFKTYFISMVLQLICGIVIAVAPHIVIYSVARLAIGATCSGVYLCAYVLSLEFIGPDNRTTPGLLYPMFYATGYALLAPLGYFVHDFRTISWILAVPSLLFMPYYFFMDESVQWLLGKKRIEDAEKIVLKAAKYNKKELSTPIFTLTEEEKNKAEEAKKGQCEAFVAMFKDVSKVLVGPYPNLRKRFLALFALWFINSGSYYGLTLNTKNLAGNFLLNFFINAVMEIGALICLIVLIAKFDTGRRKILMSTYFGCGLLNLIVAFLQGYAAEQKTLIVTLAMLGKFAISGAYAVIYLFSTEQFPTVIKNSGLGVCSFTARIGGILCPYVIELSSTWEPLPLLIFGAVAVVAGLLMFVLPETHRKVLPTTLDEGEKFGITDTEELKLTEDETKKLTES